jgi:SAM-dependent methyltransferase
MTDDSQIIASVAALRAGAKRRATSDRIQKWSPYYAGYSLEFAEAVLRAAALTPNAAVLDPWNGSGTTTLAAARLGFRGHGVDLNPYAVLVARARLVSCLDAQGVRGFVRDVAARPRRPALSVCSKDPMREWLSAADVADFRRIQQEIVSTLAAPRGEPLTVDHDLFPPLASFLLLTLIRAARSLIRQQPATNPTVLKASAPRSRKRGAMTLSDAWLASATQMGDELPLTSVTPGEPRVRLGDARSLATEAASVDFVLTSPPYCTRLDYGESTRFEVATLLPERMVEFASLRRELMGAPLVRRSGRPDVCPDWPISVRELLQRIRSHPSKASDSYYFKTYHQYFSDADAALGSIAACLKPGARAAIVVQDSYYKEIKVDLASLYGDLGEAKGLRLTSIHRIPVRTVLSTIHPGTQKYRRGWTYDESLVLLRKETLN